MSTLRRTLATSGLALWIVVFATPQPVDAQKVECSVRCSVTCGLDGCSPQCTLECTIRMT
jgi:hypothetical protein